MIKVSDIFDVCYGVNLELNALIQITNGINFVSRTSKNNGISAKVEYVDGIDPIPPGTISVAAGGSVMESFLQTEPYYSGRDLYYLTAKIPLTDNEKLYYCICLRTNKYRFNYGRQANRSLRDILIPEPKDIPEWVNDYKPDSFINKNEPKKSSIDIDLSDITWADYLVESLFEIKKGKRLTKANMIPGRIPFIGSIDNNNGVSCYVGQSPIHRGNTITVNYNGSVAEAFYQPVSFWACDDCNVLYPKFKLNPLIALFITTVIRNEKYRFNYGRKWHVERMRRSIIKLPAKEDGTPNWTFMEQFIAQLPYSSSI